MLWERSRGPSLEFLQDLQSTNFQVKGLEGRPKIKAEYVWLYDAYNLLSPSRTLGAMGEYYIPLSEYNAYFTIFKLDDLNLREYFVLVLTQVDRIMLEDTYAKNLKST